MLSFALTLALLIAPEADEESLVDVVTGQWSALVSEAQATVGWVFDCKSFYLGEPRWLVWCRETRDGFCLSAASLLERCGASTPTILAVVRLSDNSCRIRVCERLLKNGRDLREVLPTLLACEASRTLDAFGPASFRRALPVYLDALKHRHLKTVATAKEALSELSPLPASCLPALRARLGDAGPEGQKAAADLLGNMGAAAKPALGDLRRLCTSANQSVQVAAALAIAQLERDDLQALTILCNYVSALSEHPRLSQTYVMPMVRASVHENLALRHAAVKAIYHCQRHSLWKLLAIAEKGDRRDRRAAIAALGRLGPSGVQTLRELAQLRRDPDSAIRQAAIQAMTAIDPPLLRVLWLAQKLMELRSNDPELQRQAADELVEYDRLPPTAAKLLPPLLADHRLIVRLIAARCLLASNTEREAVLTVLFEILEDYGPDEATGLEALAQITKLESASARTCHGCCALGLDRPVPSIRVTGQVMTQLGQIGPAALPALLRGLKHSDENVRGRAVEAIGSLGPAAATVVPALLPLLDDRTEYLSAKHSVGHCCMLGASLFKSANTEVRYAAVVALGEIGPAAATAAPVLGNILLTCQEADYRLAPAVVETLGNIGLAAKEAVPVLRNLVAQPDIAYRPQAVLALVRIEPDAPGTLPMLRVLLEESRRPPPEGDGMPSELPKALALLGPRARPLIPELAKIVAAEFVPRDARDGAIEVLTKLQPDHPALARWNRRAEAVAGSVALRVGR